MKAYIISYFGSKENLLTRAKRYLNHNKQVKWWHEFDPNLKIVILAMDYDPHEYLDLDYVDYIIHPVVRPAAARNVLLELFYNSQDPWALFLDNDVILNHHKDWPHTHFNINQFIRANPNSLKDITLFAPHFDRVPGDGAFTSKYNNTSEKYLDVKWNSELCFDRLFVSLAGAMFFYQNQGQKIYMDTDIFPAEDQEFCLNLYLQGYKTYKLRNIIMKEYNLASTWAKDRASRVQGQQIAYEFMSKKYNLPDKRHSWKSYTKNILNLDIPKRIIVAY